MRQRVRNGTDTPLKTGEGSCLIFQPWGIQQEGTIPELNLPGPCSWAHQPLEVSKVNLCCLSITWSKVFHARSTDQPREDPEAQEGLWQ